jgi:hypothetical protein
MQLITRFHQAGRRLHWSHALAVTSLLVIAACGSDATNTPSTPADDTDGSDGPTGDASDGPGDIDEAEVQQPDADVSDGPDSDGSDETDTDGSDVTDGPDADGADLTDGPDALGVDVPDVDGSDLTDGADIEEPDVLDPPDSDGSDVDGSDGDVADGTDGAPCDVWCADVATTCGETPWAFPSPDACASACASLSGDGLTCRRAALSTGTDGCADAAVTSVPCGACEGVCGVILAACPEAYASVDACLEACALWPDDGAASDVTGDSVQCRYNQALAAFGGAASCGATTPDGGGICTTAVVAPTCEGYCALVTSACDGPAAAFDSESACLSWCTQHIEPDPALSGDTLGCRNAQAEAAQAAKDAGADATAACAAAGPLGGGVCGDECTITCEVTEAVCPDAWPDAASCLSSCADLPIGEPTGATLSCRLAGLMAGDDAGCVAAGGGGPCAAVGVLPTCAAYCAAVTTACSGADAQYQSEAACLAFCGAATLVPGQVTDAASNTLGCRRGAAQKAATDPGTWCDAAGPSGGGQCGTPCGVYCQLATALCGGGGDSAALYSSPSACQSACAIVPPGDGAGDTLGCRVSALVAVATSDASCDAAGPASATCVDASPSCVHTCHRVQTTCTGGDAQYPDQAACLSACDAIEPGKLGSPPANTVACRYDSARDAALASTAAERATACDAAGLTGGGVCGSWCDVYCPLAATACPTLYPSDDCAATCAGFSDFGSPGDVDGDSVQCRITWLGAALDALSPGATPAECAYASASGGGVCGDADVDGDGCGSPFVVTLPTLLTGDTTSASDDLDAESCESGGGTGSPELVYAFTATQTGTALVTVDAEFDSVLYARAECDAAACLAHDDLVGPGVETLSFDVEVGATYAIIVDGFAGDAGAFTIELAMKGASAPGETCEAPLPAPTNGEPVSGLTTDRDDDHAVDDCGLGYTAGDGAADLVYTFTAPAGGQYTIELDASYDSVLYVLSQCSMCLGADDAIGPGVESVTVVLAPSETIAIVVDGYDDSGSFSLSILPP